MITLIIIVAAQSAFAIAMARYYKSRGKEIPAGSLAIAALIPVAGIMILVLTEHAMGLIKSDSKDIFKHNSMKRMEPRYLVSRMDLESEINIVPVEEALLLNEGRLKRKLIVDTVKDNPYEYIEFLKMAIDDSDDDASHYAASLVIDMKRKLNEAIQNVSMEYEKNKIDIETLKSYTELVGKYYESGLMDNKTKVRYGWEYSRLLSEMIDNGLGTTDIYEKKISTDIEIRNIVEVKSKIMEFKSRFPKMESPYLLELKFCFLIYDNERFKAVLSEIDENGVKLSKAGKEIVKYWK
jgi:hypothetical protein